MAKPIVLGLLEEHEEEIDEKVDKVSGKGLSTNDYTTEDKEKLSKLGSAAYTSSDSYDAKGASDKALASAKTYIDDAIAQKSQVQIITWEDDD